MDFQRKCDCGLCDTLVPNNNPKSASKIHKDFFATIHAKLNIASSGFLLDLLSIVSLISRGIHIFKKQCDEIHTKSNACKENKCIQVWK